MVTESALLLVSQDAESRRALWNASGVIPGLNAERWRYDHARLLMKWDEYGNRASKVGWEISYVVAPAQGGADHIDNLHAVAFISGIPFDQPKA
jgi:hypothetical protein